MSQNYDEDVKSYRFVILALILTIFTLVLFLWPIIIDFIFSLIPSADHDGWQKKLKSIPHQAIATALLTYLLTQVTQEWYGMQKQLRKFYRALLEPKFIIEGLEPKIVRSTFRACVEKMTKQPSFAEDLLAILERKILHTNDYRMQYKITGNLMESKDDDGIKSHFFYDLIQRIQYDAVIETDNKEFLIITDQSIFDRQKASSSIEHRFLVHRNWIFGDDYHSAFDVSEMTIDGVRLKKKIADSDGGVGKISFSVPKKFLDGKQHRVIYVINEKIPKRGHQIFFFARIPCYGYYCELDYSQTDIYHMDYNCMLTSKEIAVVQKIPPEKPFKIAVDVQNSWVLPGGGVFFTWSRLSERRSEYESGGEKYPDDKERIMMNL